MALDHHFGGVAFLTAVNADTRVIVAVPPWPTIVGSGKIGTVAKPLSGIDIAGLEGIGRIRSVGLREGGLSRQQEQRYRNQQCLHLRSSV
jgi:hypothetical protein